MPDFERLYYDLFNDIALSNTELLGICHEPEVRKLLSEQKNLLGKSMERYLAEMHRQYAEENG